MDTTATNSHFFSKFESRLGSTIPRYHNPWRRSSAPMGMIGNDAQVLISKRSTKRWKSIVYLLPVIWIWNWFGIGQGYLWPRSQLNSSLEERSIVQRVIDLFPLDLTATTKKVMKLTGQGDVIWRYVSFFTIFFFHIWFRSRVVFANCEFLSLLCWKNSFVDLLG